MISILIDTNILHQEGLSSRNMRLLKRLIEDSYVEIFIPDLVKKEFITRRIMESEEKLKESHNNLSLVMKKANNESEIYAKINYAQEIIRTVETNISDQIHKDFENWITEFKVTIMPFEVENMHDIINDYFQGSSVFKKPKSREDLPDAMINTSVTKLLTEKGTIVVLIKDSTFKKHLKKIDNVTMYDSLIEFLSLEETLLKISQLDALSLKVEEIKTFFLSSTFNSKLLQYLKTVTDDIEDIYLESNDIIVSDIMQIDTFGESINYPNNEFIENLNIISIDWLENMKFSIKVKFEIKTNLNYYTDYGEYMYLEEHTSRTPSMDSMDEGTCEISEEFKMIFSGYIEINISDNITIEDIKTHCNYLTSDENPIKLQIQIEEAELIESIWT